MACPMPYRKYVPELYLNLRSITSQFFLPGHVEIAQCMLGTTAGYIKKQRTEGALLLAIMFISIFQESASALTNPLSEKEKAC